MQTEDGINAKEDEYDDDEFEEEDDASDGRQGLSQGERRNWKTISFDEIELGDIIGGGSVGLVHRGYYQGRAVALKTLFNARIDDASKREYMDELLVLSQLRHPNIVHFLGACMVPPNLFYVMELCERSLFDLLHNCRRNIGTRQRLDFALDVSRSMAYLHSRNPPIIHRDLKSLNLLMAGEDGPIKLCDFGLVRTAVTAAGTPAYMAPELLQERPYNKSIDCYAFGIVLWEIFSRAVPFSGYEAADVKEAVVSGGRPKVPGGDCPAQIGRLMCQCWSQSPQQRPTFDEIENLLPGLLRSTPPVETKLEGEEIVGGDCLDDLLGKAGGTL